MKKFAVTGARKDKETLIEAVMRGGFEIDDEAPDFVVTYGGDGSILWAENKYPSVPKITVLGSETSKKCMYKPEDFVAVLEKIKKGNYTLKEEQKLEASFKGRKLLALNEIQVRNRSHVRALRFSVFCKECGLCGNNKRGGHAGHDESCESKAAKAVFENIIGDGAVIATPFGSGAYYYSVGGKPFEKGIGIALNNPYDFAAPGKPEKRKRYAVVPESSEILIKILRDVGLLASDNSEEFLNVEEGDIISVKAAQKKARFVIVSPI